MTVPDNRVYLGSIIMFRPEGYTTYWYGRIYRIDLQKREMYLKVLYPEKQIVKAPIDQVLLTVESARPSKPFRYNPDVDVAIDRLQNKVTAMAEVREARNDIVKWGILPSL